ncbi:hypothetical protein NDU88_012043 [Pleurodeles waltl]|uniref:Uncharacterized protein n=1 Tax=Pleurodeles waltl TaxID=8319 RepID=A0AAV7R3I1_PLEWA|nr:hypothetical protein NDU88_012043 [Pleurodeles waltl]
MQKRLVSLCRDLAGMQEMLATLGLDLAGILEERLVSWCGRCGDGAEPCVTGSVSLKGAGGEAAILSRTQNAGEVGAGGEIVPLCPDLSEIQEERLVPCCLNVPAMQRERLVARCLN